VVYQVLHKTNFISDLHPIVSRKLPPFFSLDEKLEIKFMQSRKMGNYAERVEKKDNR